MLQLKISCLKGARCSSVVRAFAHGAMGRRIDASWGGPIQLYIYIRIEMHNEKAQRLGSMTNNIEKKAVTNTKEAQNRKTGNYDKRH